MAVEELRKLTKSSIVSTNAAYREEERLEEFVPSETPLATWWVQKSPATTYWRTLVPARHLPGQALSLRYSDVKTSEDGEVYLPRQEGVGIFQFVGNATRALIMAHLQEQGVRVLIELDDSYLTPPPHLAGQVSDWKTKIDRSPNDAYSFQAHRKIVRWVDGLIVSTDELANRYAKVTGAPIYVCPNSIDLDDWPVVSKQDGLRGIGYAGSASHRHDLALIEKAMDWAWRQPNVRLWKLGAATWRFPCVQMPWTDDLAKYRKNLQVLDVGLCPLKRSDWHDCKSDIKAMELLLAGAVPIVQADSPVYRDWVGIVPSAATEKDWLRVVKWAVGAPREELQEVWQRGYDFLLDNKLIQGHIAKWHEAIA